MTQTMTQTMIPEVKQILIEPRIVPYKARFVIERTTEAGTEWWNGAAKRWIWTSLIHAPSFSNPKASYYRSEVTAYEALKSRLRIHHRDTEGTEMDEEKLMQAAEVAVAKKEFGVAEHLLRLREAELKTHPDRRGNPDDFKKVQQARELLLGS